MSAPSTTMGPVEWIAVAFPGPTLSAALAPAVAELVRSGTVRLLDAVVVHTSVDGVVWGNRWAAAFGESVAAMDGTLLAHDRLPRDGVERALRAALPDGVPA